MEYVSHIQKLLLESVNKYKFDELLSTINNLGIPKESLDVVVPNGSEVVKYSQKQCMEEFKNDKEFVILGLLKPLTTKDEIENVEYLTIIAYKGLDIPIMYDKKFNLVIISYNTFLKIIMRYDIMTEFISKYRVSFQYGFNKSNIDKSLLELYTNKSQCSEFISDYQQQVINKTSIMIESAEKALAIKCRINELNTELNELEKVNIELSGEVLRNSKSITKFNSKLNIIDHVIISLNTMKED